MLMERPKLAQRDGSGSGDKVDKCVGTPRRESPLFLCPLVLSFFSNSLSYSDCFSRTQLLLLDSLFLHLVPESFPSHCCLAARSFSSFIFENHQTFFIFLSSSSSLHPSSFLHLIPQLTHLTSHFTKFSPLLFDYIILLFFPLFPFCLLSVRDFLFFF